jgi:hypothetical protein
MVGSWSKLPAVREVEILRDQEPPHLLCSRPDALVRPAAQLFVQHSIRVDAKMSKTAADSMRDVLV